MTTIAMEEYELMKDSKYRMYVAAVDKALKNFEYTSEWADLISALGKLNKVLLGYTKFPVIPRRIKISKRLAQCMHPALPSGVHLKALETYDIIFKSMGTNRLSNELFIYSAGLFPLLGHAAMNIRPTLLKVYETHFVPLRERLRPALSGFLSGVLPGLDTGSDHFERTNLLLENVCEGVGPAWFYTCIWQCVRSNSPVRLPAISYVLAHYSRKVSMEDQLYLMGNDIDVMVSGLCAAVQDSSVLVQRSALDLLLVCFPMHNTQLLYADMVRLVTAALSTILRRDMSLNRRLYSWLLNSDANINAPHIEQVNGSLSNSQGIAYDLLTEAIRVILKQTSMEASLDVKPYRLLTSLFDKPQIGPVILDAILYEVFRALYISCLNQQKQKQESVRCVSFNGDLTSLKNEDTKLTKQFLMKHCQELIKNANLLFNTLQSYYIWSYIEKLYERAVKNTSNSKKSSRDRCQVNEIGSGEPSLLEICILADFMLEIIPIETNVDDTSDILPNLFIKTVKMLKQHLANLTEAEISASLRLCTKVLKNIQPISLKHNNKIEECGDDNGKVRISAACLIDPKVDKSELNGMLEADKELKMGIEKSKSDSKINENLNKNELTTDNNSRERSNSNQMLKKKDKSSPRIEKKGKNKKSKSSSKLYEMKKNNQDEDSISAENLVVDKAEPVVDDVVQAEVEVVAKTDNKNIAKCLRVYTSFYVMFVSEKVLPTVDVEKSFQVLVRDKEERTRQLEKILRKRLECSKDLDRNYFFYDHSINSEVTHSGRSSKLYCSCLEYEDAMCCASNILLEFSAFPGVLQDTASEHHLPFWLKVLTVCACSSDIPSKNVQITAMNTILEVVSLAKSQTCEQKNDTKSTNIVVMGILDVLHVNFLEEATVALELMCQILWDLLGNTNDQNQITQCVTLMYHMHNIFEDSSFLEEVICRHLSNEQNSIEFCKRFSLLWHLGRDLNVKLPALQNKIRNFDRALLRILDHLDITNNTNLKLLAESFLTHGLLRSDLSRIIDPLLTMLLAPGTARVSIRYVNIRDSELKVLNDVQDSARTDEAKAKKVYAVSSINGNIMYHVTENSSPKSKSKWYNFSKSNSKRDSTVVSTISSITENFNVVTKKNADVKVEASPVLDVGKGNVKLFVNPLNATKELYPDGASGTYNRIDTNEYEHSSSESLSSSNDTTDGGSRSVTSMRHYEDMSLVDRDSGFESHTGEFSIKRTGSGKSAEYIAKRNILEHIEPIEDGVKDGEPTSRILKSQSFDEKSIVEAKNPEHISMVHSWSYSISDSDNLNAELELSTAAEEFFKGGDKSIVLEVLNEIIDAVCRAEENVKNNRPAELELKAKPMEQSVKNFTLYPMHYHICLYYEVMDSNLILYALSTLKNCLTTNPQLFIRCLSTAGLKDLRNNDILYLLARHRKSILGSGFSGDLNQDYVNFYRGYTFLDVIMSICLNYSRSFYPCLDDPKLTEYEVNNNLQIQIKSLEILDVIIKNLITLVKENSKGFSGYIADALLKCKMQKVLLHCLLTSVRNFDEELTFAEEILLHNNFKLYDSNKRVCRYVEAFQIQLLRLIHSLIVLEHHLFNGTDSSHTSQVQSAPASGEHLTYSPAILIPQQQMFLSAIMSALRHQNMKSLHQSWCNMVTSCLPYFGDNLKQISLSVIHQICNNIEKIADTYKNFELSGEPCTDYAITQLESLTIMCHYCLLDSSQTINQAALPALTNAGTPVSNPGELFNNLVNAFFSPIVQDACSTNKQNTDNYKNARKVVLSHMPRIITSVAKLWQTICNIEDEYNGVFGNSRVVKKYMLEFLSPIAVHHGSTFLAAIAVAWYERRNPFANVAWNERRNTFANVKTVLPEPNVSQSNLVYLISAIRVIPLDNLVQTVTAVIRNPPPTEGLSNDICLDVSVLELFYCYMRNASATQLSEAWSSLLTLIRECGSLSPPAQFLLAALLHELMIKCCPLEERKKDQKDLQDATAKLIECVSQVCGSCLEQTTWLRRNLAVKEQTDDVETSVSVVNGGSTESNPESKYSVQAQLVLSEILASILDICYGSSEKDKVITILTSLMYNIVPYLKTHTVRNMPSFYACSKLLASLSSYQYTRKAWKKDVFDLLLDNALFQMDHSCIKYWRVIVDNLMTHDNTTFRDLMSRVSMTQTGSLNIFTSREQEYEQRAQLLKRLAFVIFCSETDQYAKYMPDIQEQLTTSLRLSVPGVQAQVFLCFRVLLIRMSSMQVTSLWPIIISEMLQVFLQIEQELSTDTEEFSSHIKLMSALDSSWATNSSNGLHALGNPHWLRLQLATAKLLDLALLLPATSLPQFQMYRWAFVGDDLANVTVQNSPEVTVFVPHVTRIANLMDQKFTDTQIETLPTKQNELLLTMNNISQLKDLHGFFKTLSLCSNRHRTDCSGGMTTAGDHLVHDRKLSTVLDKVDRIIEMDFLDKISR